MAIGFLVNDVWAGFYSIPIVSCVEPFVGYAARKAGQDWRPFAIAQLFYPPWLMEWVNLLDLRLREPLRHRWGWNLFVLGTSDAGAVRETVAP